MLSQLALGATPIINSGDSHSFWLGFVKNATFGSGPTAPAVVEFAGGSVTSQGYGDLLAPAGPVPGGTLSAATNAVLQWVEDGHVIAGQAAGWGLTAVRHWHGALVFKVTASSYVGQVFTVDNVNSSTYVAMCDYAYAVAPGARGVMSSLANGTAGATAQPGCVSTIGGVVPGTLYTMGGVNTGMPLVAAAAPAQSATPLPSPPPPPMPPMVMYTLVTSAGATAGVASRLAAAALAAAALLLL